MNQSLKSTRHPILSYEAYTVRSLEKLDWCNSIALYTLYVVAVIHLVWGVNGLVQKGKWLY